MCALHNNPIDPSSSSRRFQQTHEVMIISSDGEVSYDTIQADMTIKNDSVDTALAESLTSEICDALASGSIRKKGIRKILPFVNSGGGTCNSVLEVYLLPPHPGDATERLYIILGREEDVSAGTVALRSIPFDGNVDQEFRDYIKERIQKTLTNSANELGFRAARRAAHTQHLAGKHRPKDPSLGEN